MTNEEWAFVAPYLTLMNEDAPQRRYELREVFNALRAMLRWVAQRPDVPTAVILDARTRAEYAGERGAGRLRRT